MHPQILRSWPRGRQALAIRAHNLSQHNGKRNYKTGPIMMQKKIGYKICSFFFFLSARVGDKMTKTGTADLMKCASKIYF